MAVQPCMEWIPIKKKDINIEKKISVAIFHGALSNEPEAYLEPSQAYTREQFCKNS